MVRYTIEKLSEKFNIALDVSALFFYEVYKAKQINDLIENMDKFETFEELKKHYLGGTENEL